MAQPSGPGCANRNTSRRGSLAVTLTIVCIAAAASSCGHSSPTAVRVPVLPTTAARGRTWEWTSACRFGPRRATGCEPSAPVLGTAQLAGNEWNLGGGPATTGAVTMAVSPTGRVHVKGDLSDAPPCTDRSCITSQANTWVRGYPSLLYGIDQCNAKTSPPQAPALQLPMNVRSIPADMIGSTTYDVEASKVTHDVAYDIWLNASDTKAPCRKSGTLEVMVWTDYDARSLLPDSLKVGTATVPFAINGVAEPGNQAWSVYVNNVFREGRTQPWGGTVWLVPDAAHTVGKGTVSVDLSSALAEVGALLQNNYGWRDFASNYWLDTIAFGMEFGPENADPYGAGPTDFSMDLSSYCFVVRSTVAAAAC